MKLYLLETGDKAHSFFGLTFHLTTFFYISVHLLPSHVLLAPLDQRARKYGSPHTLVGSMLLVAANN